MKRVVAVGLLLILVLLPVWTTDEGEPQEEDLRNEIWAVRYALAEFMLEMATLLKAVREEGVSPGLVMQIEETLQVIARLLDVIRAK